MKKIPSDSYIIGMLDINIAELYIDLEQYKFASEYLHKASKKLSKKTEILYKLGELYHIQKGI